MSTGVAWWQCHGWAKHIALSMSTRASVATWIDPGRFRAFKRLAHPNFAGRHLHILWLWDHNCVPKNVMVYHPKNIAKIWSGIHPKLRLVSQATAARVDHDLWKGQWTSCPWGNRFRGGKEIHEFLAVNIFILHSCGSFLKRSPPQYVLSGCGGSPNWLWWQHFVRLRGTDLSFLVNAHLFGHKLIIDLIHHLSKVLVETGYVTQAMRIMGTHGDLTWFN